MTKKWAAFPYPDRAYVYDAAGLKKAWSRLQTAVALAPKATEREQAFIQALSARYVESPPDDRRPPRR